MDRLKVTFRSVAVLLGLVLSPAASATAAGLEITGAWARATLPGQTVAGVYMRIRSNVRGKVVSVKSVAAKAAELHQMTQEGGVMKMRRLESLDLPAGKPVALEPGGVHVMLLDIRKRLKPGDRVHLVLTVEQQGKRQELPVEAVVQAVLQDEARSQHEPTSPAR